MPSEKRPDGPGISPATLGYGSESSNQVVDLYVPGTGGPWPLVLASRGGAFRVGRSGRSRNNPHPF